MNSRIIKIFSVFIAVAILLSVTVPALAIQEEPPEIVAHPQSLNYPEGSVASYDVVATGTGLQYHWYIVYNDQVYDAGASDAYLQPWAQYVSEGFGTGPSGSNFFFEGIDKELDGAQIFCVVSNSEGIATSERAYISVGASALPPQISVPAQVMVYQNEKVSLQCRATDPNGGSLSYIWYETSTGRLEHIIALMDESSPNLVCDTSKPGTRYYVCGVWTQSGGYGYSSVIPVTVLEPEEPEEVVSIEITKEPAKTQYQVGDSIDLKGMVVRVYTSNGFKDLFDGIGVEVSPKTLTGAGEQKIAVTYEGCIATFTVTVAGGDAKVTQHPKNQTAHEGETVTFECEATKASSYQWYMRKSGGTLENPNPEIKLNNNSYGVQGATSKTLTLTASAELNGYNFFCIVRGDDNLPLYTQNAVLTVLAARAEDGLESGESEPNKEDENSEASNEEKTASKGFNLQWWMIVVPLLIALLGGGGVAFWLIYRKKRGEAEFQFGDEFEYENTFGNGYGNIPGNEYEDISGDGYGNIPENEYEDISGSEYGNGSDGNPGNRNS